MGRMHKGQGILTALNRTRGLPGNHVCEGSGGGGGSWQRKPFAVIQR